MPTETQTVRSNPNLSLIASAPSTGEPSSESLTGRGCRAMHRVGGGARNMLPKGTTLVHVHRSGQNLWPRQGSCHDARSANKRSGRLPHPALI